MILAEKGQIKVQAERELARGVCRGQLLQELGNRAENDGFEVVGDEQLLNFPRRVKTLHKRSKVVLGWKVAARLKPKAE